MECPRCRGPILGATARPEGGPYRRTDDGLVLPCCERCRIYVLDVELVAQLRADVPRQFGALSIERRRRETRQGCPSCKYSLETVTLAHGQRWVDIEECARCGTCILDEGELEGLLALSAAITGRSPPAQRYESASALRASPRALRDSGVGEVLDEVFARMKASS
jgi:Zn-finger nucleic acid-binding protein